MTTIKKYTKKDGSTAYMFQAYLGVDPLTGKKKRTTRRGFKTQKEAKLALAQLQIEIESNSFSKKDYSTFKEVYELWFANYKNTVKESSVQRVQYLFNNQILPKFGHMRINKINTAICQKIVNEWNEENAPTRLRSYTKKVFTYAMSLNLISSNPMDNILVPRKRSHQKAEKENFLDRYQLKDFLGMVKQQENFSIYTMFHVLAYTGLRKGELVSLTWSDIDFTNQTLSINKTGYYLSGNPYITSTKTNKSTRIISVDNSTISLLKQWKLEQKKFLLSRGIPIKSDKKQLVFSNDKNNLIYNSFLNEILRKYSQYNITPHGFRHTHASLLFEAGASIKQVQERLGHTNINTTLEIYTHVTKEAEKESAEKFLNYMNL
ncbi:site-specific integrase [Enterococcus hirae]|uniref:site-specific integrase n=1 Tax=Enterococcus hirae TaxID=1354 RepID=UPI000F6F430E|nr:site-specific integrase [Enterococcus hirae]VEE82210.1 integrase [Enterococcus hirae]